MCVDFFLKDQKKKKLKRSQYLNNPNMAWKVPAKNVTVNTRLVYPMGSIAGSTRPGIMEDSSIETTATGPIAISLELPITAYIRGGTTLVSR